jgi:hypothetical protein
MPYTKTYGEGEGKASAKWLKISGDLVVTGNSNFHINSLEEEDLEELGGVEYRALRVLGYVVTLVSRLSLLILLLKRLAVFHIDSVDPLHCNCWLAIQLWDLRRGVPKSVQGCT